MITVYEILSRISYLPCLLLILCAACLSSCEKVIDVDLNSADKKYVIEANITDLAGTAQVIITQTSNFDEPNDFPHISGATVTISESGGATTTLPESTTPGYYEAPAFHGTSGKTYTLTVNAGGKTFTAVSVMPTKVKLDTMYITDELLFTDTRKTVNAVFDDPAGFGNNYRFVQYVNGIRETQVMIRNDEYSDGRKIVAKLFYFTGDEDYENKIESGDEVKLEMQCIDKNMYKYWYSLDRSSTGGSGQATPSNPVTNIQGGALGYFSAHTLETRTIIAP